MTARRSVPRGPWASCKTCGLKESHLVENFYGIGKAKSHLAHRCVRVLDGEMSQGWSILDALCVRMLLESGGSSSPAREEIRAAAKAGPGPGQPGPAKAGS